MCIWDNEIIDNITNDGDISIDFLDDELVGVTFFHKIVEDGGKSYKSEAVRKLQQNPDLYLVEILTGPKKGETAQLTGGQISSNRGEIIKVISHQSWGEGRHEEILNFDCLWDYGKQELLSITDISRRHVYPPQAISEYILSNGLLKSSTLPAKFAKWINDNLGTEIVEEVTDHRTGADGKLEILCRYSDNAEEWCPIDEVKNDKDDKVLLAAYASKNELLGKPGFRQMKGYWLEKVHEMMCKKGRTNEIQRLVQHLYGAWKKSFNNNGANHHDTLTYGRAYKKANEMEKHGNLIELPYALYKKVPPTIKKLVLPKYAVES